MQLSRLIKYSTGSIGLNIMAFFITEKLAFFYDPKIKHTTEGITQQPILPLKLVILALIIGRIIDAFSDPYIGNRTDYSQSNLGRRKKYMLIGLPLIVISFIMIWHPPFVDGTHQLFNFLFLLVIVNIFFTSYTLFAIPYDAYITEISSSKKDRITASSLKSIFAILGIITTIIIIGIFNITTSSYILATVSLIFFITTLSGIKEKKINHRTKRPSLFIALKKTFSNKDFLNLSLYIFFIEIGGAIFIKYVEYFSIHIVSPHSSVNRESISGILLGFFILAIIIAIPFWYKLSNQLTKKRALLIAMYYLVTVFPLFYFVGFIPNIPVMTQSAIYFTLVGFGYSAINIIVIAKIADISDQSLKETNIQNEASFFGVYNFIKKMALGGGMLVFMIIIESFDHFNKIITGFRFIGPAIAILVLLSIFPLSKTNIPENNAK